MDNLLNIQSIPISISLQVTSPYIEISPGSAELSIERERGGLQIESKPVRFHIDHYTPQASTPIKPNKLHLTYKANGALSNNGKSMNLDIQLNDKSLSDISRQKLQHTFESAVQANSSKQVKVSMEDPIFRMKYEMDKLNFDWRLSDTSILFIPGDIEIIVNNYPEVLIEYVGDPLYIPPSSNPNYEPE